MNDLRDAIFKKLNANETLAGLVASGGVMRVWDTQVPGDSTLAALPYVVFTIVSNYPEWGMGSVAPQQRTENALVQFSIFSETANTDEAWSIYNAIRPLLDFGSLSIVGYTLLSCERVTGPNLVREDNTAWHIQADWMMVMQTTTT